MILLSLLIAELGIASKVKSVKKPCKRMTKTSSSGPIRKSRRLADKEGSFIDNDTEDIIRNGCEGWTICENHSSVFILLCNIFRLYLFNNGSFLFTISTLKSIIIKQYLQ